MRKKKIVAALFIAAGIALAAVTAIIRLADDGRAEGYIRAFEESSDPDNAGDSGESPYDNENNALLNAKGVIGIIEIPELELRYPIFEGAGSRQLDEGIGHMENTAPLCEKGNCVLAGHNGSRRGTFFTNLDRVHSGSCVILTNKEKETHTYTVSETRVTSASDGWITETGEKEQLTLFTCADHGSRRFACRCEPAE